MNFRMARINLEIKNALSTIISQMDNSKIAGNFITISAVNTSPDLYSARVDIAFLNDDEKTNNEILETLNSSKGYIRKQLSNKIRIKRLPDLFFVADKTEIHANRVELLLAEIARKSTK